MAWNQSDNNGYDRDPWKKKSNNNKYNGSNKHRRVKGLVNLKNIFHKLGNKINIFCNKNNNTSMLGSGSRYASLALSVVITIWACSGFYTIKEMERGVVLRFGKFNHLVYPGLNWKPTFIDTVTPVNVGLVRELAASGVMLTSDENVVRVEMNVQYRVTDPAHYLFEVTNADDSLRQATDSALRGVIGKYTMDRILTEGRTVVRSDTQHVLEETIKPYNMGITLLDVNFQAARPPEEVKAAFDDAIAARENEQQYIREAEAYSNEVQPRANGQAQRILEEGRAYRARTILEAQGEVQRFTKVLPEYKAAPEITRERLYIDTMEHVLNNTKKILIDKKASNNVLILPLNQILDTQPLKNNKPFMRSNAINIMRSPIIESNTNKTFMDQRRANAQRNHSVRKTEGERDA